MNHFVCLSLDRNSLESNSLYNNLWNNTDSILLHNSILVDRSCAVNYLASRAMKSWSNWRMGSFQHQVAFFSIPQASTHDYTLALGITFGLITSDLGL